MKNFIAVVSYDGANRVTKHQDFDLESEANNHILEYGGFVVVNPGGHTEYWIVDPNTETLTHDQAQQDLDETQRAWNAQMRELDSEVTPRIIEDIFDAMDQTNLPPEIKDVMDRRKRHRATRVTGA